VCTKVAPTPNAPTGTGTVTTTYFYDKLNRLTKKTYNDTPTTPTVSYGYDADTSTLTCANVPTLTDTYPKGQRTAMCDGSGATAWAHDQMGRALTESRMINGTGAWTKSAGYTYNFDGSIKTISNPGVGRVMTYTTNAAGRPISVVNTGGSLNFVTSATYAPFGGLASYTNSASIKLTDIYNKRLQPCWMYATTGTALSTTIACTGTVATATIQDVKYNFGLGVNDNGNVLQPRY
jgi:hypothetical protein